MATVQSDTTQPAATATVPAAVAAAIGRIPELQAGDHLTRIEFERRYAAMPKVKKAELIEGVVYMPSPVSHQEHGGPHFNVVSWLGLYCSGTPAVEGGDNSTVRLDLENEPQPDVFLRIRPKFGGQSRDEDTYVAGPPELIAEVSASSASYDLHEKLRAYQRNGVREIPGVACLGLGHRLVRASGRPLRATAADRRGPLPQRGLSGPLARPGRLDSRRLFPGHDGAPAGTCLARACRVRRAAPGRS